MTGTKRLFILLMGLCLIVTLSSCASKENESDNSGTPALDDASQSQPEKSTRFDDDDIINFYSKMGFTVRKIYSPGGGGDDSIVIINYGKTTGEADMMERFDWFHRDGGIRHTALEEQLSIFKADFVSADKFLLIPDLRQVFATENTPNEIITLNHTCDTACCLSRETQLYYAPLESTAVFGKGGGSITSISENVFHESGDFGTKGSDIIVSIGFDGTDIMYSQIRDAGKMTTAYADGIFTIICTGSRPSDEFHINPSDSGTVSPVLVESSEYYGENTVIKLRITDERITRFAVTCAASPADGRPYAIFAFSGSASYPEGW